MRTARWCTAALAGLLVGLTAPPAAAADAAAGDRVAAGRSVVLVGVPGLRWDDVDERATPTLWRLAGGSSLGALSVRAGRSVTCPADGWLTISAGNRAVGPELPEERPEESGCTAQPAVAVQPDGLGGRVPGWGALRAVNEELRFDAGIGTLGTAVGAAGGCTAAYGAGAALGVADRDGTVDVYAPALPTGPAALRRCPLTAVEVPDLAALPVNPPDFGDPSQDALEQARRADRRRAVRRVDTTIARLDRARPPGSTLLVAGVSETGASVPRLHLALAVGPAPGRDYGDDWLTAASTRRAPFVQLFDLGPTVLGVLGVDPGRPTGTVAGQRWATAPDGVDVGRRSALTLPAAVGELVDLDIAAQAQRRLVPPFFSILVALQLLLYGGAAYVLRRLAHGPVERAARVRRVTSRVALAFAAAPVSTYLANLVPWWRQDHLMLTLLSVVVVSITAITALALLGPWRRALLGPVGVVAAVTAAVLAVDLVTGARLQLSSLAGYSPLVAGRFAGVGNVAFAVFATGMLLATAAVVAGRRRGTTLVLVAVLGLVALVVDGHPRFGSDFGGVLALVPGFAVLGLIATGARVTWRRLLVIGVVAVAAVGSFALLDFARPAADRSHLGRFVAQVLDGEAGTVVQRKAAANLRLLTHSVLTVLVPFATLFLTRVLLRPVGGLRRAFELEPAFRAGLVGTLVMGVVGFLANDSGVAVPALAMTVAIPAAIAVSVRALDTPAGGAGPARRTGPTGPGRTLDSRTATGRPVAATGAPGAGSEPGCQPPEVAAPPRSTSS